MDIKDTHGILEVLLCVDITHPQRCNCEKSTQGRGDMCNITTDLSCCRVEANATV